MKVLLDRYRHKIKTTAELTSLLGTHCPHARKVVLCHGVFDIVHPGHLRHLMYARSQGEVLVASLTADKYIDKAALRPHVPEELRALNLAALECVDYVLIDDEPTPHGTLQKLQPDVYAKGFEYNQAKRGREIPEVKVVEAYGGAVIYTPGDVVYSSSALLEVARPDLRYEKLSLLMQRYQISFDDLHTTLGEMVGQWVHVVGDTIVDSLTHCTMIGGMTKTPTMSVKYDKREDFVGGAGIVAKHLSVAGAHVMFSSVVGDDALGKFVVNDLRSAQIKVTGSVLVDPTRPTTNKNAYVVGGYRMLKVDTLDNRSISDQLVREFAQHLSELDRYRAVVFADFRHGMFNKRTIPTLTNAIPKGCLRVADSQVATRWGNILEFPYFDLITPNEREARFALGDQDSVIRALASKLYDESHCETLILKLGALGVLTCLNAAHNDSDSFLVLDSFADRVVDAVGAGDALLAYATLVESIYHDQLSLNTERVAAIATILGMMAAGVECELEGNVPVVPEQVHEKINQAQGSIQ